MFLTTDQTYLLELLRQVGFLRADQVFRLLSAKDCKKRADQAEAALRQLLHMRKIKAFGQGVYGLPFLDAQTPDPIQLEALDIILALGGQVDYIRTGPPPFALHSVLRARETPRSLYVVFIPSGKEAALIPQLQLPRTAVGTIILRLESPRQMELLPLNCPCYYAIRDGPAHRFYQGSAHGET